MGWNALSKTSCLGEIGCYWIDDQLQKLPEKQSMSQMQTLPEFWWYMIYHSTWFIMILSDCIIHCTNDSAQIMNFVLVKWLNLSQPQAAACFYCSKISCMLESLVSTCCLDQSCSNFNSVVQLEPSDVWNVFLHWLCQIRIRQLHVMKSRLLQNKTFGCDQGTVES